MTLDLADLDEIKHSALEAFGRRVAEVPANGQWEFDLEANRLESQALQRYQLSVILARRNDALEATAAIWDNMMRACDDFAARVSPLAAGRPSCSTVHDRILDLRNKCRRLRDLHA